MEEVQPGWALRAAQESLQPPVQAAQADKIPAAERECGDGHGPTAPWQGDAISWAQGSKKKFRQNSRRGDVRQGGSPRAAERGGLLLKPMPGLVKVVRAGRAELSDLPAALGTLWLMGPS